MIFRTFVMVCKPLHRSFCKVAVHPYRSSFIDKIQVTFNRNIFFPHITNFRNTSQSVIKINEGNDAAKEQIISKMNFESLEHAQPFYKLQTKTLVHILKVTKDDERRGYCKNRLYFLSSKLKCPPSLLSKYVSQKYFVYSLSFDWLAKSLNVLLEMGVPCDRIIRDLWVLKYKPETIQERLQRIKAVGIDKLYPWMVRCSEDILKRYITITQETKHILGNNKSTHIYLAKRLNTTLEDVEEMCIRTPSLKTIRVIKVKKFLDYLISEGIKTEDIANKPRILSASQNTVKERIDKLRQLGFQDFNLNVLCRSRKHFKYFCNSFEPSTKK